MGSIMVAKASDQDVSFLNLSAALTNHACRGFATFSYDRRSILVCNLKNGIDSYSLSPFRLTKTFKHSGRIYICLQITTALRGTWVMSGSDDGAIRIFDPVSGQMIHCLRHGDREFIKCYRFLNF
jgi:hypothetical protein